MPEVRDFAASDHDWARRLIAAHQGGDHRVARLGDLLDPLEHEGIVAEHEGRAVALMTVAESERGLEVLTLHSETPGIGAGTRLLETAVRVAAASGSPRVWLVTTNDNVEAIGWYLRRGLVVAEVHGGAVDRDREALKPALPARGAHGIPIRDLIELQHDLADGESLTFRAFPRIQDIDALPQETAAGIVAPLFEDAPRFLERLVAERPFGDDETLLARAAEVARTMPEEEQAALLDAHPRIGAAPATVSPLSHAEQGYGDDARQEPSWIGDELDVLNDAYERIFGFRFVIFVAGRPRSAILPILEASLRDERVSELRRGIDDVIHIAADRLRRLRGGGG